VADANGHYVLWPVAMGRYDVVIAATGKGPCGGRRRRGRQRAERGRHRQPALLPDPSFAGQLVSVRGGGRMPDEIDAAVRVQQPLVRAARPSRSRRRPADAETGAWAFALPLGAPGVADWSPGVFSYGFSPVPAAAGLYRVEATAAASPAPKAAVVDLNGGPAQLAFSFP
jgi:hypothetical protein